MTRETIERPLARPPWRERSPLLGDLLTIAAIGVLSLLLVGAVSTEPPRIDQLTVANPTEYELFIEVRGVDPGAGWMPLAIVSPQSDVRLVRPIDVGDSWTLRFHSQGETAESISVRREELGSRGWRLEVPRTIADQLRALGASASPQR